VIARLMEWLARHFTPPIYPLDERDPEDWDGLGG
jgi:hypothetical protein